MQVIGKEALLFALIFERNYFEYVIQKQNGIVFI